jgi:WD40 repeat protein
VPDPCGIAAREPSPFGPRNQSNISKERTLAMRYWDYLHELNPERADFARLFGERVIEHPDAWKEIMRQQELATACRRAIQDKDLETLEIAWIDASGAAFAQQMRCLLLGYEHYRAHAIEGADVDRIVCGLRGTIRAAQTALAAEANDVDSLCRLVVETVALFGGRDALPGIALSPSWVDRGSAPKDAADTYFRKLSEKSQGRSPVAVARECVWWLITGKPRPSRISGSPPILYKGQQGAMVLELHVDRIDEGTAECYADPLEMSLLPIKADFLESVRTAWEVARKLASAKKPLPNVDVRWRVRGIPMAGDHRCPTPLEGGSAGAILTVVFYQLLLGEIVDNDCAMTATVDEHGNLSHVDWVEEKVKAAMETPHPPVQAVLVCNDSDNVRKARDAVRAAGRPHEAVLVASTVPEALERLKEHTRRNYGGFTTAEELEIPPAYIDRRELTDRLSHFIKAQNSGCMVLVGGMGRGKSTWLRRQISDAFDRGDSPVYVLIGEPNAPRNQDEIAQALYARLRRKHHLSIEPPEWQKIDDHRERLRLLLRKISEDARVRGNVKEVIYEVIYIDGADQAETNDGPLLPGILDCPTPNVLWVVTSRPDVQRWWKGGSCLRVDMDEYKDAERGDIRAYLWKHGQRLDPPLDKGLIDKIFNLKDAAPVFFTVSGMMRRLEDGECTDAERRAMRSDPKLWVRLPEKLISDEWDRARRDLSESEEERFHLTMGLLALAGEPLSRNQLEALQLWDGEPTREFLKRARNFFHHHDGDFRRGYQFDHPGYVRALVGEPGRATADAAQEQDGTGRMRLSRGQRLECHRRLAAGALESWQRSGESQRYAFKWLPHHLAAAEDWDRLEELLLDLNFLEAKIGAGMAFDLPEDFARAAGSLSADRPKKRLLQLLDEALRRDIDFIDRHAKDYPQGLFQCLWNSCWWNDCPEAANHYDPPAGGWPPESAPWQYPEPKLSTLLERWASSKNKMKPSLPWLRSMSPPRVPLGTHILATFAGDTSGISDLRFSLNGRWIGWASPRGSVFVGGLETHRLEFDLYTDGTDCQIYFSEDGEKIVVGFCRAMSDDGEPHEHVDVFDIETGKWLGGHLDDGSLKISPDGRWIAIWKAGRGTLRLEDTKAGVRHQFEHTEAIRGVEFSSDGLCVAVQGKNQAFVWNLETGTSMSAEEYSQPPKRWEQPGRTSAVPGCGESLAHSHDERLVILRDGDGTVCVRDTKTDERQFSLDGHPDAIREAYFTVDGRRIITESPDVLGIWETDTGRKISFLRRPKSARVAISEDGCCVACGTSDGIVHVWSTDCTGQILFPEDAGSRIETVKFSPGGNRLLSIGHEFAQLWDTKKGRKFWSIDGYQEFIEFAGNGRRIVTMSNGALLLWDSVTGGLVRVLNENECDAKVVRHPVVSSNGRLIAASGDNSTCVWETKNGGPLHCFDEAEGSLAFSLDSRRIAIGGECLQWWDVVTGKLIHRADGGSCHDIAFTAAGNRIGAEGHTVWDAATGRMISSSDHSSPDGWGQWAFSPDGRRVVSCHYNAEYEQSDPLRMGKWVSDWETCVWDVETGRSICTLQESDKSCSSPKFLPDNKRIVGRVSSEGTVPVWSAETGALLDPASREAGALACALGFESLAFIASVEPGGDVTAIVSMDGSTAGYFPLVLDNIQTHPSGRAWAGSRGPNLYLLALEEGQGAKRRCGRRQST